MSRHRRTRVRFSLAGAALLAAAAMVALPSLAVGSTMASVVPARTVIDAKQAQGGAHGGGGGGGGGGKPTGYDISYPQCGHAFPTDVLFGIVGVNGGRVYLPNPCLGANGTDPSELAWAEATSSGEHAQLYANTADPGPAISSYWPDGQASPYACNLDNSTALTDRDTNACNYDYGWNAAENSYQTAVAAYASLGDVNQSDSSATPYANTWWLDVETANSWRTDVTLNVLALQGAAAYLASRGVTAIGFYSTASQWSTITGDPTGFEAYPSWVAGARTIRGAQSRCSSTTGFTGGAVDLAQYFANGFDADLRCP